jgi:hypothetical protein
VQVPQNHGKGKKKPDSKENLASEEGDEKLFVGLCDRLRSRLRPSTTYIVDRGRKSLAKSAATEKITLFLRKFKG